MPSLLLAACAAVLTLGQDTVDRPILVDGRVTALNGDAVPGAIVRLQGIPLPGETASTYSQSADGEGKFAFGNVSPGLYTLTADKLGFVTHHYGARSDDSPAAQLTLDSGIELRELSLRMTPLGMIYGRVLDQDGRPVAKAQMNVFRYEQSGGRQRLVSAGAYDGLGASDEQGNYRVSHLPTGRYYVKATPPSASRAQASGPEPQTMRVAAFYPGAPDSDGAIPVEVQAGGEVRGIDIRVLQVRAYSIRGKVIYAATGAPAPGKSLLEIVRVPGSPDSTITSALLGSAKAGPDGSFEMRNLMPGRHILRVLGTGTVSFSTGGRDEIIDFGSAVASTHASGQIEVSITDSDVNGVVLALTAGTKLSGVVEKEEGDLKDWRSSRRVYLVAVDGMALDRPFGYVDNDGGFEIEGIPPAKYFPWIADLPQGVYIKSIRLGNKDVTHQPLDLISGTAGPLEIVLSSKSATLSGTVHNEGRELIPNTVLALWPTIPDLGDLNGGIRTASVRSDGTFQISGIAPGDYFVAAWDTTDTSLIKNPDFLARFANDQVAMKLGPSEHHSVDVKLIPRDKMP